MTTITVTNIYDEVSGDDILPGTGGRDRLVVNFTIPNEGMSVVGFAGSVGTGYSGMFDGPLNNNVSFSGFEDFSYYSFVNGTDYIVTGDGDDIISTNAGNDTIQSGGGIDQVDGGSGTDIWGAQLSNVTSDLAFNLNEISTYLGVGVVQNVEGLNLTTGSGNDSVTGHENAFTNDELATGDGDDIVTMRLAYTDDIRMGTGDDTLILTNALGLGFGDTSVVGLTLDTDGYRGLFDGYLGNNLSFSGVEHFSFTDMSEGNDYIQFGTGNDSIDARVGNDTIDSGSGFDTVNGGDGIDRWKADLSFLDLPVNINLNGPSSYHGAGSVQNVESMILTTGGGNDTLTGHQTSSQYDHMFSGGGDDLLTLWVGGDDIVAAGAGDDRLIVINDLPTGLGGTQSSAFALGADGYSGLLDSYLGNNISFSGIEHFTFTDESGAWDNIQTGSGDDSLTTGIGDDTIASGGGRDTIDGGVGTDRWDANLSVETDAVVIDLNGPTTFLGTASVKNVEGFRLQTGSGNDILTGHETSHVSDAVDAGSGDDLITLRLRGNDTVAGGAGNDHLVVINNRSNAEGGTTVSGFALDGNGYSGLFDGYLGNNISFTGIDRFSFLDLSGGHDRIVTGAGNDSLNTGGGNDTILSGAGEDTIDGSAGDDHWTGDLSADTLGLDITLNGLTSLVGAGTMRNVEGFDVTGGSGNDRFTGHMIAKMNDTVRGNGGDDEIILWLNGSDSANGGSGSDRLVIDNSLNAGGVTVSGFETDGSGYSGLIDGYLGNDIEFSNIEHFTYFGSSTGSDNIRTGDGDDSLFGGSSDDTIDSGAGDDTVDGGDGVDLWIADQSTHTASLIVDLNTVSALPGDGSVQSFERMDLVSGNGNDTLVGYEGATIKKSNLHDRIVAGGGDDFISLWMGGTDYVDGGSGDDRLSVVNELGSAFGGVSTVGFEEAADGISGMLDGYLGNNLSYSGIEHFSFLDLNEGADHLQTGRGNDSLIAGGGNDTIDSGAGADTVDGGAGIDLWYADQSETITPITIDLNGFSDLPNGGSVVNFEAFRLSTGAGNDTLIGHQFLSGSNYQQSDSVTSGAGNDQIKLWLGGDDTVNGGSGIDTLSVLNGLGLGGISLHGLTQSGDGWSGLIDGYLGHNIHFTGIDRLVYSDLSNGHDSIAGLALSDEIDAGGGNDTVNGGAGNDTLIGGSGNDILKGDAGFDRLEGGSGADTMEGGENGDLYLVDNAGDVIIETLETSGVDKVVSTVDVTLWEGIETLVLAGSLDTNATGNDLDNYILASTGNNVVIGCGGHDRLEAAGGDDTLFGGGGNDTLNGGPGSDIIHVDDTGDRVAESRRWAGTDTVISSVDFRMGTAHIENLELTGSAILGAGNGLMNLITGNDEDNILDGGKNIDTLIGGEGNDTYLIRSPGDNAVELAGEGIDTVKAFRAYALDANVERLFLQTLRNEAGEGISGINGIGNELDNTIVGNPFDNVLVGRNGRDTLKGQAGADTFVFDRPLGPDNYDRIIDFNVNEVDEGDILRFKADVLHGMTAGPLDATMLAFGPVATDPAHRFIFDQAAGKLYWDTDGSGNLATQVLLMTFDQNATVTIDDIEIF